MKKYKDLISIAQLFLKNRSYENKSPQTSDFGDEVSVGKINYQIEREKRCCFAFFFSTWLVDT